MQIADLIFDIQSGSPTAQQALFVQTADQMMALCCRYLKRKEDAEEALLNGYFKFFTHISNFVYQSDAAFYGWLKKLMVNECLMFLRKKHVFTIEADMLAEQVVLPADVIDRMQAADIRALVLQLPVGYRTVFNLYEIEGYSHIEIAEALGIAVGTSKSQLSKARQLLQKMYHQQETNHAKRQIK